MYYALTIRGNLITGVHTSAQPFKNDQFKHNPKLASDEVVPFDSGEYATGHDVREYVGGVLLPIVDRIKAGFADVPPGHELIDGELVKLDASIEIQPPSIRQRIEDADARIAALEEEIAKMRSSVSVLSQDLTDSKSLVKDVIW